MNYSNKLYLCITMLTSFSCFGMMHQLIRDENGFRLSDGKQAQIVKPHFVDPLLKRMSPEQLKTFVEQGNRIKAIRLSNGEHRLQAMVTGLGGGPVGFAIGYGMTKALCWSGLIGAGIGVAAATGGAALGIAGVTGGSVAAATGALAASGSAIAGSVGVAGAGAAAGAVGVGATAGFAVGATAATTVGTAIATGATLTGGAAVLGAGAVEAAGTVAAVGGLVTSIEAASVCVGLWLGALTGPF